MTDCVLLDPIGFINFCDNFHDMYKAIIVDTGSTMKIEEIKLSPDGATNEDLYLFRVTEVGGAPCVGYDREAGPILLMPDCFEDASSWFEGEGDTSFPAKLCMEGYDVWLLNPKSV